MATETKTNAKPDANGQAHASKPTQPGNGHASESSSTTLAKPEATGQAVQPETVGMQSVRYKVGATVFETQIPADVDETDYPGIIRAIHAAPSVHRSVTVVKTTTINEKGKVKKFESYTLDTDMTGEQAVKAMVRKMSPRLAAETRQASVPALPPADAK